jgi:hypothetical protein
MEQQRVPQTGKPPVNLGDVMATVEAEVRDLDFGSILLKVHEGQVVSIETSRKLRLGSTRR